MTDLPPFSRHVESAVSGRLLCTFETVDGPEPVPCVLEAHLLPGVIGSSVYFLAAVGPSTDSWPYFPSGGVSMVDHDRFQRLIAADDNSYYFETSGDPVELAEVVDVFELDPIDGPGDLIDRVLLLASQFGLQPWSEPGAAPKVEECSGWDYFDEFMALPVQPFPEANQ